AGDDGDSSFQVCWCHSERSWCHSERSRGICTYGFSSLLRQVQIPRLRRLAPSLGITPSTFYFTPVTNQFPVHCIPATLCLAVDDAGPCDTRTVQRIPPLPTTSTIVASGESDSTFTSVIRPVASTDRSSGSLK